MKTNYLVGAGLLATGAVAVVLGPASAAGAYAACALVVGIALTIFFGTLGMQGHKAKQATMPEDGK